MLALRQTEAFRRWFESLRNAEAKRRIAARLVRLSAGLLGDVKPVGEAVSELRVDYGAGYRVYFVSRQETIILLCGGDKRTQTRDIAKAKQLAKDL